MKTKEWLKQRRAELIKEMAPFRDLQDELNAVEKALSALEPSCNGCYGGCNICRTGPDYR